MVELALATVGGFLGFRYPEGRWWFWFGAGLCLFSSGLIHPPQQQSPQYYQPVQQYQQRTW